MLEKFVKKFKIESVCKEENKNDIMINFPFELYNILDLFGGCSVENGLYRFHTFTTSHQWAAIITEYFEHLKNNIFPFGFDWMGRQFCLSSANEILLMFDPATGEDYGLKQTISLLHDEDFVNDTDDMLSINLFKKVLEYNKFSNIEYNKCIGYKLPLFLGGKDEIGNYELQDLEVYWHIDSQLYKQAKDLPPGTKVNNIRIEKP